MFIRSDELYIDASKINRATIVFALNPSTVAAQKEEPCKQGMPDAARRTMSSREK